MKKVAILTIVSTNYGNRLQNYALQTIINSLGYEAYTLKRNENKLIQRIKRSIRNLIKQDSWNQFAKFNRKIKWGNEIVNKNVDYSLLEKKYDAFVMGSDQIWNYTFNFISEVDFLPGIKKNKKMSYAASFGMDKLPANNDFRLKELLEDIEYISVREDAGANIIKEETGLDAIVHIDPTLCLSKEEWEKVSQKPNNNEKYVDYIFVYFLGEMGENVRNNLEEISKENNLKVITFSDISKNNKIGPAEFIYCIQHATLIVTDSFHASVFSFIFERPFLAYSRGGCHKNMNSRLLTLLRKFDLERKYVDNGLQNELFESNYSNGKEILKSEVTKSMSFLKDSLEAMIK